VVVVSEYPRKILGWAATSSRSISGRRRIESSPPIVETIPAISGSAIAAWRSSTRACGCLARKSGLARGVRHLHHRDAEGLLELPLTGLVAVRDLAGSSP
jgi:hypothetical protein